MFRGVRALSLGAEARLGRARSPVRAGVRGAMHRGEEKETMRGLNERLAGYLSQVRLLEEANSKLEEQIKEVVKERRAGGHRDWSRYEKTISSMRDQVKEMTLDNARLMLQIDNARLAADDFKVKFEAEIAVRQGVDQDILSLRKMIDDTQMSSMQLESEVESLTEELQYLKKNHEQDLANVKNLIRDSSVDVQMDAAKGQDLSVTIDKIRQQYENAAQKSREETEAWYRNKFDSISAEVSRNTDALQQGQNELNDLRRQKQGLEIDLQTMHSMNRSLEETLNDTVGRYSQTVSSHNMVIQQLEPELAEVHAQVVRQGLEYQALLNIKSKLEEEIATYHSLLEGTGMPYNGFNVPGLLENYGFKGRRAQDDVHVKSISLPEDLNVNDNGAFENASTGASGLGGNDESVDFSLEQALCAGPRNRTPDQTLNTEIAEEETITQKDLELNAANTAKNNRYIHKEAGRETEEDPVILDEMEVKDDYNEMVSSGEEPVIKTNEEKETVSPVVDTSVENTAVKKVEEAASPVKNTGVEKVEEAWSLVESTGWEMVEKAASPVKNTQEEKVEEESSPVENTGVELVEEAARTVENTQEKKVEKAVSPVENTQVEKAPGSVEDTQLEEAPGSVKRVEEAQSLLEDIQLEPLEKALSPVVETQVEKVEEAACPLRNTQTKKVVKLKPVVENHNPEEQKEEFKSAVENINPEEQEEEFKSAVENINPEEYEEEFKSATENINPEEQEEEFKSAVENINPEEYEEEFKSATENINPEEQEEEFKSATENINPEEQEEEFKSATENINPEEQEEEFKSAMENINPEEQEEEFKSATENINPEEQEEEFKSATENINPEEQEEEFKSATENINPEEQEEEFKSAMENINPEEEEEVKQKGDEPENPEREPLLNVSM